MNLLLLFFIALMVFGVLAWYALRMSNVPESTRWLILGIVLIVTLAIGLVLCATGNVFHVQV